jgi:SSS family solute:Na+ symporter
MGLGTLDLIFIGAFFLLTLLIGLLTAKNAGTGYNEYFLSGRNMHCRIKDSI